MKKNTLDKLLKAWGDRNQPDVDTLSRLESRIRNTAMPEAFLPPVEAEPVLWVHGRWAVAAAVLLLLGMAAGLFLRSGRNPVLQCADSTGSMELARFTEEQMTARRTILDEVERLFAGQIRWVRIDDGGMRLGIADDPVQVRVQDPKLVVRMVIVARQKNQKQWKTVWSSDVLTRAEEYIEIPPDAEFSGAMGLWVHQLPDGRFAVDSEIDWPSADLARSYETRVLSAGQPERILSQRTEGLEYRIYQSVEPLMNGNG